jgi:hypothetical protein
VPKRLLEGFRGILLTDGYEAYANVAESLHLKHAGCWAHVRRKFDEVRKAQSAQSTTSGHAGAALEMIRELYLIERALWRRDQPITPEHRVRVRAELSAPVIARLHAWLEVTCWLSADLFSLRRRLFPGSLLIASV